MARPISFRDRAGIFLVIGPANAVADLKVSGLITGHFSTCLFLKAGLAISLGPPRGPDRRSRQLSAEQVVPVERIELPTFGLQNLPMSCFPVSSCARFVGISRISRRFKPLLWCLILCLRRTCQT
jgi:hypothetical protein